MTVVLVTSPQAYVGVSGDTKPTTGVLAGAEFYETDTRTTHIYDGSAWNARLGVDA